MSSNILSKQIIDEVKEIAIEAVLPLIPQPEDDRYLSVKSASEKYDIDQSTLRKWLRRGKLRKYNFKGCIRIKVSELEGIE